MSRISIYGIKKDRKAVLEYLQRQQIIDISEPDEGNKVFGFYSMNTGDSRSEFMRNCGTGERALDILAKYAPENKSMLSSLNGKRELTAAEYYGFVEDIPEMLRVAKRINELAEEIEKRHGLIARYCSEAEELEPWLNMDIPMNRSETESTACLIGTFGDNISAETIIEQYNASADNPPPIYAEVISSMMQQTCVFILCLKKNLSECEQTLRSIGFSRPKTLHEGIPKEETERLKRYIASLEDENKSLSEEIISYKGARNAIRFMADYYSMRAEKYNMLSRLSQNNRVFVINGYIPQSEAERLTAVLEHKYNAAVETEPADDNAPVLLNNKRLAQPVEGVVKTFALPRPREIDPTAITAFFYYIFFGLMLSDAGYGLIMTIGCAILLKRFRNMEDGMKRTLKMFMFCGISTIFWGAMFGSWFGDAVYVISSTFFGKDISIPPLWFEPVGNPMKLLMFSFLLGLIHLFTGLGIKLYQCIKARDYASALSEGIFWYMLVGGGVVYLFHVDMFLNMAGITAKLPDIWANAAAAIAGAGALGIVVFTAQSGGIGKRIAKGAYALYGVTGWLSDILSYSRLLALGLATGVIATVFNKMGSMFGGGILGMIIFILVFLIGHTLNIGVNLLGAYVHTNRLQFVEFFGKFYEGGGNEFEPYSQHTKYYKFKEE